MRIRTAVFVSFVLAGGAAALLAQTQTPPPAQRGAGGGGGQGQAGGNYNPDGSLRPSGANRSLFSQEAYTEYAMLEPGSAEFRIRYLFESRTVGATEMINGTRGGSEGSGIEVYDPRTGQPVKFVYEPDPRNPADHQIRATLPRPIPQGGMGRVLIYKTYKDDRTYMINGDDLVWVRNLNGYRLAVILPKGWAFTSSSIAAQMTTTDDGRLKLAFANPSGQANEFTVHAHRTTATFPPQTFNDMFFDDVKTLYDLDTPDTGRVKVEQTYRDYRKGSTASLDSLAYMALQDLKVTDLDTAEVMTPVKGAKGMTVKLGEPIVNDKQSVYLKLNGTLVNDGYTLDKGELVFTRTLHGLRNTILLPAGWEVSAVSQSGTIGTYQGRSFVALVNLNAENNYSVTIRARRP